MDAQEIHVCHLCSEYFNDDNRPRVMQCGHTHCTNCIKKLVTTFNIKCPSCQEIQQRLGNDLPPVNYYLEKTLTEVRKLSDALLEEQTKKSRIIGMDAFITDMNSTINDSIGRLNKMIVQFDGYHEFLGEIMTQHTKVVEMTQELAAYHTQIIQQIKKECEKIIRVKEESKECEREGRNQLLILDSAESKEDVGVAFCHVIEEHAKLEERITKYQKNFPDVNIAYSKECLQKSLEGLSAALLKKYDHVPMPLNYPEQASFVERYHLVPNLKVTAEQLSQNLDIWKKHLKSDSIHAIHFIDGSQYVAKISLQDDNIHLHCLSRNLEEDCGWKVEQKELLDVLDETKAVSAFMDLSWNESRQGRIHIRLPPRSPLANQFRILCTGEIGKSYIHSNFISKDTNSQSNKYLKGGDYEYDDGDGGATILDGIDCRDAIYTQKLQVGSVRANLENDKSAIFEIVTEVDDDTKIYNGVFGLITSGMEVIQAASQLEYINEVQIVDCGVVIPL